MIFKKKDFKQFVQESMEKLRRDQDSFKAEFNIDSYDSWYYDQPSGVFELSKKDETIFFEFQSIGTFSRKSKTWLWAWANKNTYPNVRTDSEKIREFGLKNKYDKLTKSTWDAEEEDGWEMLAIASRLLNPLGVYRIDSEDIPMFIILTKQLTLSQSSNLKENSKQLVDCGAHGLKRPAFVCQHLNSQTPKGFHEAFETLENMDLDADDDFQAWCDECEEIRVKYDGWNEESEKFAKIKLICEGCYFDIKQINV